MRSKTITQLVLITLSVLIIITYIQPTYEDMENIRAEAEAYQDALDNANSYNTKLQELYNTVNSFNASERRALNRYLPTEIDTIAVMRDIETIVKNHSIPLKTLSTSDEVVEVLNENPQTAGQGQVIEKRLPVRVQRFELSVVADYEQFVPLLQDFERNAYPLEVAALSVTPNDEGPYNLSLTLETYSLVTETD